MRDKKLQNNKSNNQDSNYKHKVEEEKTIKYKILCQTRAHGKP